MGAMPRLQSVRKVRLEVIRNSVSDPGACRALLPECRDMRRNALRPLGLATAEGWGTDGGVA